MASRGGILGDRTMAVLSRFHRWVLRVTRGRLGWRIGGMPSVRLHTTGRHSGLPRTTMLSAPIVEVDRVVLVASKGGSDRHPAWYLNLIAFPDAELDLRDGTRQVRTRTASAAEKAVLWPRIVDAYAGYARYQRRTRRDIPVVICEPR
jgi:deazaflavin-dependent oxidoreductase (nitroreductase family)